MLFRKLFKQKPPPIFSRVEITWLPNPINNSTEKSCYIGSVGTVRKVYEDGSFDLQYDSGAISIVHDKYRYKIIKE